jgi:hypothetical protein
VYPFSPIFRCRQCGRHHRRPSARYCLECAPNIGVYRSRAAFRFNVYEFPDRFDLVLVERVGWYSPTGRCGKNRNNMNLDGASRDHLYTVSDGFHYDVDPTLLAHPANCEIVLHRENASRARRRSRITLDELRRRIAAWDEEFGKCSSQRSVKPSPSEQVRGPASGSTPPLLTIAVEHESRALAR